MDDSIIKFIVDLGSIGAICWIVYLFIRYISEQDKLNAEERTESHRQFCETIVKLSDKGDNGD